MTGALSHDPERPRRRRSLLLLLGGHGNLHDPRLAQKLRALPRCDPLGQPLDDARLADARANLAAKEDFLDWPVGVSRSCSSPRSGSDCWRNWSPAGASGSNQFTSLPEALGNLLRLEKISAFGNSLTSLPESLGNLAGLQMLLLSGNQLEAVKKVVSGRSERRCFA